MCRASYMSAPCRPLRPAHVSYPRMLIILREKSKGCCTRRLRKGRLPSFYKHQASFIIICINSWLLSHRCSKKMLPAMPWRSLDSILLWAHTYVFSTMTGSCTLPTLIIENGTSRLGIVSSLPHYWPNVFTIPAGPPRLRNISRFLDHLFFFCLLLPPFVILNVLGSYLSLMLCLLTSLPYKIVLLNKIDVFEEKLVLFSPFHLCCTAPTLSRHPPPPTPLAPRSAQMSRWNFPCKIALNPTTAEKTYSFLAYSCRSLLMFIYRLTPPPPPPPPPTPTHDIS